MIRFFLIPRRESTYSMQGLMREQKNWYLAIAKESNLLISMLSDDHNVVR